MPDYTEVKKAMVAERYRAEQTETRMQGIQSLSRFDLAVECYAGTGGLTEIYKKYFNNVVNNDINPQSVATHNMKAIDFIREEVACLEQKIDMIDFDCYGCPAFEIHEFFKIARRHAPFVLALSDGLGMYMKRNSDKGAIQKRYFIENPDMHRIWDRHGELIDHMMSTLAVDIGLKSTQICSVQTRSKNYILAAYVVNVG